MQVTASENEHQVCSVSAQIGTERKYIFSGKELNAWGETEDVHTERRGVACDVACDVENRIKRPNQF